MIGGPISAVIFDMDGLLIDSEPHWREVEVAVFQRLGVPLTEERCAETMGLRIDEVVRYWHQRHPWPALDVEAVAGEIERRMVETIAAKGTAKEGVNAVLDFFEHRGLKRAVASSSRMILINAVVDKLNIREAFDVLHSAEFEPQGKPHPGVFLTTATKLDVAPSECVVFEDSLSGMKAARSAGMRCIGVPDPTVDRSVAEELCDVVIDSLVALDETCWTTIA